MKISDTERPLNTPTTRINAATVKATSPSCAASRRSWFCRCVGRCTTELVSVAICPKRVWVPIALTRPMPRPSTILVPMKSTDAVPSFATGIDSPVRALSSADKVVCSITSASAGTRSPAATIMISPGTRSRAAMTICRPSRNTVACGDNILRNDCSAFSARHSCTKPKTPFSKITIPIAIVSMRSPATKAIAAAKIKMITSTLLNCRSKIRTGDSPATCGSVFHPCVSCSANACLCVRPLVKSVSITPQSTICASAALIDVNSRLAAAAKIPPKQSWMKGADHGQKDVRNTND